MQEIQELQQEVTRLKKELISLKSQLKEINRFKLAPNVNALSVEEVASWVEISTKSVKRYENQGILIAAFPNAKRRYLYEDVENFMRGLAKKRK